MKTDKKDNVLRREFEENNRIERNKTSPMLIITIAIEILAIFFIILLIRGRDIYILSTGSKDTLGTSFKMGAAIIMPMGIIFIILAFGALWLSYFSIIKRWWKEDSDAELESYSRRLKQAMFSGEIRQDGKERFESVDRKIEIDALGLMRINLEDIKEFYTWSQKQAKASFILAIVMCILGFAFMVVAIILPVIFKLELQMSIIPAIGGIITELIAGTALVVYRNSLLQLNHYHKVLHEDERFLSSVNLLSKFSTAEAQDEMLREIIKSVIQMNLAGLQANGDTNSEVLK